MYSPMTKRVYKVQAAVDSVVLYVPPVEARLVSQVLVVLLVTIVDHRLPAEVWRDTYFILTQEFRTHTYTFFSNHGGWALNR